MSCAPHCLSLDGRLASSLWRTEEPALPTRGSVNDLYARDGSVLRKSLADTVPAIELTAEQFEQRRRGAARSGQPFYLWPEVPIESFWSARAELARVTSALLAGLTEVRLEPRETAGSWTDALTVASFTSGIGPLLGWWQERGVLQASAEDSAVLALQLAHSRARAARMSRALLETASVLHGAGLGIALLK